MSLSLEGKKPHHFIASADAELGSSSYQEVPSAPITGRKDGTQSSLLGCRSEMSHAESKADVRKGLAELRAGSVLALLSAKGRWRRRAVYSRISSSVCLMLLLSNFTLEIFCQVNDPKNVFPFLPSWIFSCYGQQLKVLF